MPEWAQVYMTVVCPPHWQDHQGRTQRFTFCYGGSCPGGCQFSSFLERRIKADGTTPGSQQGSCSLCPQGLLVTVWYVLAENATDRHAQPIIVARKLMHHAYKLGKDNRIADQSTAEYVRQQLDHLGIGADLKAIPWGDKKKPFPCHPPASRHPQFMDEVFVLWFYLKSRNLYSS